MSSQSTKLRITGIVPAMGIAGGDLTIYCEGLNPLLLDEDSLTVCGNPALIEAASCHKLTTHIPEDTAEGDILIRQEDEISEPFRLIQPDCIAHTLHNVGNPAVLEDGTAYATFSGTKGQITPASVFSVPPDANKRLFLSGIMNATTLLRGTDDALYISSRYEGKIYRALPDGSCNRIAGGLGEVFGMAMNSRGEIFAGDRTGNVFLVNSSGRPVFFAQLPPSEVAYHLAIDSRDRLYVTIPLHIGENIIYRILPDGTVEEFYRDLVEFHGLTVDDDDNLLVAVTNRGKGAVHHINTENNENRRILSGEGIIGVALHKESGDLFVASFSKLYRVTAEQFSRAFQAADIL